MSQVLAITAAELAARAFKRNGSADHQCFRIKNLHADEIICFVECWANVSQRYNLASIRLLVTDSLSGKIPDEYVADKNRTITYYRNNNPKGLIYIESSVQSDEQGLQNIFSLRDSNFLDGSFDEYVSSRGGVVSLLIENAWGATGEAAGIPDPLHDLLLSVCQYIHPSVETIPVRKFIHFVQTAISRWREYPAIKDGSAANAIVGESLTALGMFPDHLWNVNDARTKRRLELNLRHSELMNGTAELSAEQIADLANQTKFKDEYGDEMESKRASSYRLLCNEYGQSPSDEIRVKIPYFVFSQLFSKDTVGLKLGDKVREEISARNPGRLKELVDLDVVAGLNASQPSDAIRFLEATPAEESYGQLKDLIALSTRRTIERLAAPTRRPFFNPFLTITQLVDSISDEISWQDISTVKIDLKNPDQTSSYMLGIFAFLFGPTLKQLSADLFGLPGACQLIVNDLLTAQASIPPMADELGEEDQVDTLISLNPIQLKVEFYDANDELVASRDHLEWDPGDQKIKYFAAFWLLVKSIETCNESSIGPMRIVSDDSFQKWIDRVSGRELSIQESVNANTQNDCSIHPLISQAGSSRARFLAQLSVSGLDISAIDEHLDVWGMSISSIRNELIPDGARLPDLDSFLGSDFIVIPNQPTRLLTPMHPIRLRWISAFLKQSSGLMAAVFQRTEKYSGGDADLYIEWLSNRSPRETPPIASGSEGELLFAKSEVSWWEDYSKPDNAEANLSFDSHSMHAVTARILSYLEAHPYKRDGLSLLVVMPSHDSIPAEIIERVTSRAPTDTRIALTVIAPKFRWEQIAKAVEKIPDLTSQSTATGIFPPIDLSFVEQSPEASIADLVGGRLFDIGVVTHILENTVVCQPITEPPVERPGHYDVLSHRPIRVTTGSIGSMALVLLPTYKDPILEAWSTLTVRNHRMTPVSPGQPENIDLVELRVNFQDSASIFRDLHKFCHWVITLERHLSREQLESSEAGAPDILSVESGIGENEKNTLIVSSRSGRDLICAKLKRKLLRIVGVTGESSEGQIEELALQVYESTRHFSPRLALQALGITRATEEILGLTIAKKLVESERHTAPNEGLVIWLSLDDYSKWFGGNSSVRADICRLTFEYVEQVLRVDVLVIEGKLRQAFDEHGVDQVKRTSEFLHQVLNFASAHSDGTVDARMWREEIAKAIEESSSHAMSIYSRGSVMTASAVNGADVKIRVLADIREGKFSINSCNGIYSICLWDSKSESVGREQIDNVTILRTYGNQVLGLLASVPTSRIAHTPEPRKSIDADSVRRDATGDTSTATKAAEADKQVVNGKASVSDAEDPSVGRDTPKTMHRSQSKLTPDTLKSIYERILLCYKQQKLDVRAAEESVAFVEGPASILFRVRPDSSLDPKKLQDKGAALKLALELEEDQNVSFGIDRGFVTIDVPKSDSQRYFVKAEDTWQRWQLDPSSLAVPIGENQTGDIVSINFSSANSPHLLVAGTTGSGKSEALNAILFGLTHFYTPQQLKLLLIDPKGTELLPFEGSQYLLEPIGMDETDAIHLLGLAVEEMGQRYTAFRAVNARSLAEFNKTQTPENQRPWWVVVLDEYADLTSDTQSKKDVEQHLRRLAAKARAAGIHIIIATQKPSAEVISTTLRSNLPAQLALRVRSGTESRVIMDESGAEYLNGKGDAWLRQNGSVVRVQCSMVQDRPQLA